MLTDLRSALFWLAVSLVALIFLQRGCQHRMDQFRERWDDRREQREQRREEKQDDRRHGRWRNHAHGDDDSAGEVGSEQSSAVEL